MIPYPTISMVEQMFIAMIFKNNKNVRNYIRKIRNKSIDYPCYVKCSTEDYNKPHLDKNLFILIHNNDLDKNYNSIIKELENNKNFVKKYQIYIDSMSHWVFVYNYPFEYYRDCELIKEGYYSKLDVRTKCDVLNYWEYTPDCKMFSILKHCGQYGLVKNEKGEYLNPPSDPIPLESFRETVIRESA